MSLGQLAQSQQIRNLHRDKRLKNSLKDYNIVKTFINTKIQLNQRKKKQNYRHISC